jgi:bifunctional non-homologous end joining protein LigD
VIGSKLKLAGSAGVPAVEISHPEKVYWPDEGYTKQDLAEYYIRVFTKLSPYVEDRLLTLERCPDGMRGKCFFQKQKPQAMPAGTPTRRIAQVTRTGRFTDYVVGGSMQTQLALVNLGCIAVHVMASRTGSPRQPDWLCIDIDPESGEFADAARAGLRVKAGLEVLKLQSYAKTSGSRGLHVLVPLVLGPDADEVLAFAETFVARVAAAYPDELTVAHTIAARRERVYLDPFRNSFGQTVAAPYSVRRRKGAPVSLPLQWSEVRPTLSPADFNVGNCAVWLRRRDPWSDFFQDRQSLNAAARLLTRL